MITTINEERLVVVSDVHLGNPLFRARRPFIAFLAWALEHDYNVCINGDGVDMTHRKFARLTREFGDCASSFRLFLKRGLRLYYVVGNHDMVLETFLDDWGIVSVAPFLNVISGDARIRIEHGHLYDDMLVKYPRTYAVIAKAGGHLMTFSPTLYKAFDVACGWLAAFGTLRQSLRVRHEPKAAGEPQVSLEDRAFLRAAGEIARRGFDVVIFGHTHRQGDLPLPDGRRYINTGCWMQDPYYVEINHGTVRLKPVLGERDDAAVGGLWLRRRGSLMVSTLPPGRAKAGAR